MVEGEVMDKVDSVVAAEPADSVDSPVDGEPADKGDSLVGREAKDSGKDTSANATTPCMSLRYHFFAFWLIEYSVVPYSGRSRRGGESEKCWRHRPISDSHQPTEQCDY